MAQILNHHLSEVNIPTNSSRIWKDECCYSFNTAEKGDGLFVDLNSFLSFSKPFIDLNYKKTKHSVYLNIKKILLPSSRSTNPNPPPPKKLAIGVEGGFNDEDTPKYEDHYSIYLYPADQYISLEGEEIPKKVRDSIDEVIRINSQSRKEEIVGWSADQVFPSKYADNLQQLNNGYRVPPSNWRCSVQGCDKVENLWINLTDGFIGCGREYSDGSGGNGHALKHYNETKYPLSVKLGTISKDTQPDVYSYPEDEMVSDPKIKEHLAHFGINIYNMQKTEKSMAELELDQNLNYEYRKIQEKGKDLEDVYGPGLTGIENLGNTCYMSSVLQALFATPHFQKRYLSSRAKSYEEITQDPTLSFEIQMSKMAYGLLSGDYSVPETTNKAKSDQEFAKASQIGIAPKMFKSLIGSNHPAFSTFQQQDSLEYFQYLLGLVERNEKSRPSWISEDDPTKAFNFILEDRIQCGTSNKVKYTKRVENVLSLPIPMEASTNKAEYQAYQQLVEANGGKKPEDVEEVRPIIPLQACINNFAQPYQVNDFYSTAIKSKTFSINSSKLETFPDFLVIHLKKYVLAEDWTAKKLNVFMDVPDEIDIENLRGVGKTEGEELLPEDDDDTPASNVKKPNEQLVNQLVDFGFPLIRCQKASLATPSNDVEAAMNWILEHGDDADIDTPIPEPAKKSSAKKSTPEFKQEDINQLESFGFNEKQAKLALSMTSGNVERAADWIFNHMDEIDVLLAQSESAAASSSSSSSSAPTVNHKNKVNDGPGKYQLVGFITHIGNNAQMGHYICHLKKNGKWIKFNDREVKLSQDPPKEFGYMYFYQRKDNLFIW